MAATKLTDKFCLAAKAESKRQVAYPDLDVKGLELRVSGDGRKAWSLRYRAKDGVQRRMTLGTYPSTDLADARSEARKIVGQVEAGKDPAAEARRKKKAAQAEPIKTFDDLATAYFKACEVGEWMPKGKLKRARTLADERDIYSRYLKKALGADRLDDIGRPDMKKAIRALVARGIMARANRAHALARQMFAYAIAEERLIVNPATGFQPLAAETPRARTLTDAELKAFWAALRDPNALKIPQKDADAIDVHVGRQVAMILQLATLLLQRRSELSGMMRSELNLEEATWLIPAERMKGGAPHLVPLPAKAVELIKEAIRIGDDQAKRQTPKGEKLRGCPCVFPSPRNLAKPIQGGSVSHAMREICAATAITDASPHDLRRTGSTAMTSERLGIAPFIRSKVLGHRGDTGGGAAVSAMHYDTNTYIAEKRRALEAWENLLLEIVGERQRASNVRQLKEA